METPKTPKYPRDPVASAYPRPGRAFFAVDFWASSAFVFFGLSISPPIPPVPLSVSPLRIAFFHVPSPWFFRFCEVPLFFMMKFRRRALILNISFFNRGFCIESFLIITPDASFFFFLYTFFILFLHAVLLL